MINITVRIFRQQKKKGKNTEAQQIVRGEEYPSGNFAFCNYRHHLCHRINIMSMIRMCVCMYRIHIHTNGVYIHFSHYAQIDIRQNVYSSVGKRRKKINL